MEGNFEIVDLDINEIQRPKKNPNKMTDFMFRTLVEGIKKDGFIYPVVIRKEDKRIIDGDHRYLAAVESGMSKVRCIILDVSEEQAIKIGIGLNQKKGYFDYAELREVISEFTDKDVNVLSIDTGFTTIELQRLLEQTSFENDKMIKQKLLEAGVDASKIDAMADVYQTGQFQDLPKSDIQGTQSKIRYPYVFFCESKEELIELDAFFKQNGDREPNTGRLLNLIREAGVVTPETPIEETPVEEVKKGEQSA